MASKTPKWCIFVPLVGYLFYLDEWPSFYTDTTDTSSQKDKLNIIIIIIIIIPFLVLSIGGQLIRWIPTPDHREDIYTQGNIIL